MKYTVSIEINAPIDEVVKRFDDPERMKEWMEGLVSFNTWKGLPDSPEPNRNSCSGWANGRSK